MTILHLDFTRGRSQATPLSAPKTDLDFFAATGSRRVRSCLALESPPLSSCTRMAPLLHDAKGIPGKS